ncbi:MAG: acetyl-CoA/propionyl-CoA carboxylase, biotin carboxylase, biotin carboxyl carrier protein [Nocardioidaceae bacterium]|jgi:3-methylcrotonyl-CoA carboxylase alpha subunit/acetyl-CoA/propionyl-CoA carboxylase biotin carboxyl carrier protein|nr:acetyl-CoA/propionyl-CoA carboxylase, biotin carboxylase, biotin carboxyl carrier protein [Nocardioidaceae bacterium]
MPLKTLLIANRGEIALRVMRTASAMGIHTVAVFTDLDARAPHVHAADEAVRVESYLDIEAIVAAAVDSGADAVHPGYGFLSERAPFAAALEAAGITLVGPSAAVMEQMGRKDAAREIAIAAGVPVVPRGEDAGYPILVKAAAGGGGKGMRIVRSAEDYDEAVASAKREAASAFGDDTMLIEKYVEHGRHIEVQIIADQHGTVRHLFERDCSTQRRHQKVLEEAPAPTIDQATRDRVTSAAVDLAAHVGYTNAGTVEFLLDADSGEVYFLEMNTRLQVEHPVTELVCGGLDLVEHQLRVAAGEPLSIGEIELTGHAIEARIYAEDSFAGFLPQAGTATYVQWPSGVRVDQALESGQTVSTAYDPMLGKVIAYGSDRESARQALVAALDDTAILGLTTNAGFLRVLVASDEFRDAAVDTAWLDHHEVAAPDPAPARELAAWEVFLRDREETGPFASDGFRLGADAAPVVVELDEPVTLTVQPAARPVAAVRHDRVEVVHHGQRFVFDRPDVMGDHVAAVADGALTAPMPGTVLDVRVAEGDAVEAGQVLGVLEAMKMELSLKAPFAGTVTTVGAVTGEQVALGDTLFVVEGPDEAA